MDNHLELYREDELIYYNNGRWVYPLFDLEDYIIKNDLSVDTLFLKDKIAGRAAAHLMVYIGIKKVHIGLISRVGLEVFKKKSVNITYDTLVDRIKCRTETLLEGVENSKEAYKILKQRAGLFSGIEISCKSLTCGYQRDVVLDKIDLNIKEGGTLLLLGENGEGKSTFLRTIANLQDKISGEVVFYKKGEQIKVKKGDIGFLNQNPDTRKMPILVREIMDVTASLLGLKGEEKKYQIEISLRRTGALKFLDKHYYELSGGEKQRVNLARLICQRAGIFILDEPAANLDKKGRDILVSLLKDIHDREMPTIIVSSHNKEFIDDLGWEKLYVKGGNIGA